jgi:DNA repair exonuclease SbcCD ATPase subunit
MVLREIVASGLKGQKFHYQLGEGTIIVGPNDAGKTAVLDAIRFVCRGKFPEVKKGDWPEAIVTGRFDEGAITRSINSKGTVATTVTEQGVEDLDLDIPLLDPEHYVGLTDKERTIYVFDRVKLPDSYSVESIIADIERMSMGDQHTEQVQKAKQDLLVELRGCFNEPSVQECLSNAVEKLRARFTYWNRRCKETQGAVKTLTELKLREEATAAPTDLEDQVAVLVKEVASLNLEKGTLRQTMNEAERVVATRKSIKSWLDEDRIDYDTMLTRVRAKRNELAGAFERTSDTIMGIDIAELRAELKEAQGELRKNEGDLKVAQTAATEATQALKDLESQTECPYCHSNHKTWKGSVEVILNKRLVEANTSIEARAGMVAGGKARIADLDKRIEQFTQTSAICETQRAELKRLGDEIDRIIRDKDNDTKKRKGWETQLEALKVPDTGKTRIDVRLAEVEEELKRAQVALDELNAKRQAETRLKQDLVRAGEAAQEHEIAAAQLRVTKVVGKLLDEKREAMVCEVFQKLLANANVLTTGILKSPLVLHDNTIGRFAGAEFVSHHWFGGTAKAITYIAIATALSMDSPFKLVLLDEFGRLDEKNQSRLLNRLTAMRRDKMIDQFIVVGTEVRTPSTWPDVKQIVVGT